MWNNKNKKIKMLNMRNRVLLYVVHFVIFLYMRMEMLTLSLNIETIPSLPKWFCITVCERFTLRFLTRILGIRLRLCS